FIFLLAAIVAALGVSLILYFMNKENRELGKNQVAVLMVLRFISFFLIAVLLLSPFIKNLKKITRNPLIIAAWDNSSSIISTPDSIFIETEISKIREQINGELSEKYSVLEYSFGEQAKRLENLNFSEKKTD